MTEDKEGKLEKFERLAGKRATDIIKGFRQLANLSGKNYAYTEDHVTQIFEAIENEMKLTRARFSQQDLSETPEFSFVKKTSSEDEQPGLDTHQ
ncbi:MAG: hypothetical protein P4L42_13965 [Desulfocapsaceae bacterium]|nr:hypothetical protein [Desulfocapsaceae bacterium]